MAFLCLGANLGDRAANIARALDALAEAGVVVRRRSALYETQPVGLAGRWFLNCVAEIETERMPLRLLRLCQRVERGLGRGRAGGRPAARPIDIDILYFGGRVIRMRELTIPHPRLAERRFVLVPLAEIAPSLRHPLTGRTSQEMLGALGDRPVVRPWKNEEP